MNKAQAAVETLLIYGVTILVVMLAIGALIGFGVLDLGSILPDKCEITGVSIECSDYLLESGNVQLQLRNSIGKNINIYNVTITGKDDNEGLWGTKCSYKSPDAAQGVQTPALIVNGEKKLFTLLPCELKINPGKKIKGDILVRWSYVGSDAPVKSAYGTINAKVS